MRQVRALLTRRDRGPMSARYGLLLTGVAVLVATMLVWLGRMTV